MPCDSRVTKTQMTDHEKLAEALEALGWKVQVKESGRVFARKGTEEASFYRYNAKNPFQTSYTGDVVPIQKKYSEIGVRKWAKARGYAVAGFDGRKMTLVNRRG